MARPAPGAERTVAVLELMAAHPDERFTLSEVARRCGLNKATAHALLSALTARGVLVRHPDEKRYSLGPRLVAIGEAGRRGHTAADFVPPVLEELARTTGLWARAWQFAGDHIACNAEAGVPEGVRPSVGTLRLPVAPPVGAVFMAWADTLTVEAWLARAASVEAVPPTLDALPVVRRQRFAVMLASPEWRRLSGALPSNGQVGSAGAAPVEGETRRALLAAVARQRLLAVELDDSAGYRIADVIAPVFDAAGGVDLTLSLTVVDDRELRGAEVRALAGRVVEAADQLTGAICGRIPDVG